MSKELYMLAHDELIAELMEADPSMTWNRAYEITAELAYERMKDNIAAMADELKDRAKYE
jgi:hypothetical protein